jgi:ubiquinone/menaquinone biosynthesis C-methylase UbiE
VILSDFSIGMVSEARNSLMDRQFSFAVCDVGAIPHDDNYFDAIIANHFLYHVRDRVSALKEIRRVLKLGGRFYATTVGDTHLGELSELVRRFHTPARKFIPETLAFTLDNGKSQLASVFPEVRVMRQNNDLKVTEVEPLANYILSCIDYGIDTDQRDDLFSFIQLELRQNNSEIFIHKDSGLFEAC